MENTEADNTFIVRLESLVRDLEEYREQFRRELEDDEPQPNPLDAYDGPRDENGNFLPYVVAASIQPRDQRPEDCSACVEELSISEKEQQLLCDCKFCTGCINKLFSACLKNHYSFPPSCCGRAIEVSAVEKLLQQDNIDRYNEVKDEFGHKDPTYCSTEHCNKFLTQHEIKETVGTCKTCGFKTCTKCKLSLSEHESMTGTCPDRLEKYGLKEIAKMKKWKACPGCSQIIEKNKGCNEISCSCGVHFCYLCGVQLPSLTWCECWKEAEVRAQLLQRGRDERTMSLDEAEWGEGEEGEEEEGTPELVGDDSSGDADVSNQEETEGSE